MTSNSDAQIAVATSQHKTSLIENIICLPGELGDVLSPDPSLAEGGDYYEYIRRIHGDIDCVAADRGNSEFEK